MAPIWEQNTTLDMKCQIHRALVSQRNATLMLDHTRIHARKAWGIQCTVTVVLTGSSFILYSILFKKKRKKHEIKSKPGNPTFENAKQANTLAKEKQNKGKKTRKEAKKQANKQTSKTQSATKQTNSKRPQICMCFVFCQPLFGFLIACFLFLTVLFVACVGWPSFRLFEFEFFFCFFPTSFLMYCFLFEWHLVPNNPTGLSLIFSFCKGTC